MSKITVNNLRKASESADRDISGVAAAWVNFNGTGVIATRDSLNVSSLTDNGAGDYSVNFSNSMGNTGFCVSGSTIPTTPDYYDFYQNTPHTVSQVNVFNAKPGINSIDASHMHTAIHGDLA